MVAFLIFIVFVQIGMLSYTAYLLREKKLEIEFLEIELKYSRNRIEALKTELLIEKNKNEVEDIDY